MFSFEVENWLFFESFQIFSQNIFIKNNIFIIFVTVFSSESKNLRIYDGALFNNILILHLYRNTFRSDDSLNRVGCNPVRVVIHSLCKECHVFGAFLVRMEKNTDQKNSEYGHFSRNHSYINSSFHTWKLPGLTLLTFGC